MTRVWGMRTTGLKVAGQSAVYHCVTRVVGGAMLLDERAKEVLQKQLWTMEPVLWV